MRAGYHPAKNAAEKSDLKKQGFYHKTAWRKLRQLALQRDHYICQNCLKKENKITRATEVHHIRSIADYPELALDLDNLTSLCWDCHEQTKPRGKQETAPTGVRIIRP